MVARIACACLAMWIGFYGAGCISSLPTHEQSEQSKTLRPQANEALVYVHKDIPLIDEMLGGFSAGRGLKVIFP